MATKASIAKLKAPSERRSTSWSPPRPASDRNYPMNCWWVAAFSHQLDQSFCARWLLDTPVLLYRTEAGDAVAIEDRCPHRAAPLSLGRRQGDAVECLYHGFTFGPDGACTRVPTMKVIPEAIRVRTFPVIEQPPFVWVYLGDPERLEEVPPAPSLDWANDSTFAARFGQIELAANYMLLKENVLDLSHFGFVHRDSFGITDWTDPPRISFDDSSVTFHQSFSKAPLPAMYANPLGLEPGTPFNRESRGSFISPALQVASLDLIAPDEANEPPAGRVRFCHATTPIDPGRTLYFWAFARDFATSDGAMDAEQDLVARAFAEDEDILAAIQRMLERDPLASQRQEISVKADAAGIQARRIVARWMDRDGL